MTAGGLSMKHKVRCKIMSKEIPVEVYEQLYVSNRELLNTELDSVDIDFNKVYMRFNRMMSALEYVEQYKLEQARRHKL